MKLSIKKLLHIFMICVFIFTYHLPLYSASIDGNEIIEQTITGNKMAKQTLKGKHIKKESIKGNRLKSQTITGDKIANTSITGSHLNLNIIDSAHIIDNSITSNDIAAESINTIHLIDSSINSAKIQDLSVSSADLSNDSVTSDKIQDGAIAAGDIASNSIYAVHIVDSAINSNKIENLSITNNDLSSDCITTDKVKDGDITGSDLASGTIQNSNLSSNSVSTSKIQNSTILAEDLDPGVRAVSLVVGFDAGCDYSDIQTAIDNLSTSGGKIFLKSGTYVVNSTLNFNKNNIQIQGEGWNTSISLQLSSGTNGINITGNNIILRDFNITNGSSVGLDSVNISGDFCLMEHVEITNPTSNVDNHVVINNLHSRIYNCSIVGGTTSSAGIFLSGDYAIIKENFINSESCIAIDTSTHFFQILNNYLTTSFGNINLRRGIVAGSTSQDSFGIISSNIIQNSSTAITISAPKNQLVNNLIVNSSNGILVDEDFQTISNNIISGVISLGIATFTSDRNIISNNQLSSTTTGLIGISAGISGPPSNYNIINSNSFDTTVTTSIGIKLGSAGSSINNTISGNNLNGVLQLGSQSDYNTVMGNISQSESIHANATANSQPYASGSGTIDNSDEFNVIIN